MKQWIRFGLISFITLLMIACGKEEQKAAYQGNSDLCSSQLANQYNDMSTALEADSRKIDEINLNLKLGLMNGAEAKKIVIDILEKNLVKFKDFKSKYQGAVCKAKDIKTGAPKTLNVNAEMDQLIKLYTDTLSKQKLNPVLPPTIKKDPITIEPPKLNTSKTEFNLNYNIFENQSTKEDILNRKSANWVEVKKKNELSGNEMKDCKFLTLGEVLMLKISKKEFEFDAFISNFKPNREIRWQGKDFAKNDVYIKFTPDKDALKPTSYSNGADGDYQKGLDSECDINSSTRDNLITINLKCKKLLGLDKVSERDSKLTGNEKRMGLDFEAEFKCSI